MLEAAQSHSGAAVRNRGTQGLQNARSRAAGNGSAYKNTDGQRVDVVFSVERLFLGAADVALVARVDLDDFTNLAAAMIDYKWHVSREGRNDTTLLFRGSRPR